MGEPARAAAPPPPFSASLQFLKVDRVADVEAEEILV